MSLQYISLESWSTCLCMHVCMPYPYPHRHAPSDNCWSLNFAVSLQTGDGSVINHRLWQIFQGFMQAHEPRPEKRRDWERHLNAEKNFHKSQEAGEQGWSQKVDSNLPMNCVVNRHSLRLDNTLSTPKLKYKSVWNENYLKFSALRQYDKVLLKLLRQLQFYSILYSYWMCSTRDATAVLCKYLHNNSGD